jgi:hypothetical protein
VLGEKGGLRVETKQVRVEISFAKNLEAPGPELRHKRAERDPAAG